MIQWSLESNASDVLGLGPRMAGRLMQLGVRTAVELLAAQPKELAARLNDARFSAPLLAAWQREAELLLAVPHLPPIAARILAALGYRSPQQIALRTPLQLFGEMEQLVEKETIDWLIQNDLPNISQLSEWIASAREASRKAAA